MGRHPVERSASSHGDDRWGPRPIRPLRRFREGVVEALLEGRDETADPTVRRDMAPFVEEELNALPLHLRIGIEAVSALLLVRTTIDGRGTFAGRNPKDRARDLTSWEASRLGPVRQYVRFFRSLVLFAGNERVSASKP